MLLEFRNEHNRLRVIHISLLMKWPISGSFDVLSVAEAVAFPLPEPVLAHFGVDGAAKVDFKGASKSEEGDDNVCHLFGDDGGSHLLPVVDDELELSHLLGGALGADLEVSDRAEGGVGPIANRALGFKAHQEVSFEFIVLFCSFQSGADDGRGGWGST